MAKDLSFAEKSAAGDKQAGFDYQFYIFIIEACQIKKGQTLSYEENDDVYINDGKSGHHIQVKHTVQTSASGDKINLTSKDDDLWKTIYTWINIINDKKCGRNDLKAQLEYINNSEFILYSNKSSNENVFITSIAEYKQGLILFPNFIQKLKALIGDKEQEEYSEVDKYIELFISLPESWIEIFIKKINFTLDQVNIINQVLSTLSERLFIQNDNQTKAVFDCIFSNLKTKVYLDIAKGGIKGVTYDFEELKSIFGACLYPNVNKVIIRRNIKFDLPEKLEEQNFIKHLINIGDIRSSDRDLIIEYTKFKLLMACNLKIWEQENEILPTMKEDFILDCIRKWRNAHIKSHRDINEEIGDQKLKTAAMNCLDEIRGVELKINEVELDTDLSNGQFYCLNDDELIGWTYEWKSRY